MTRTPFSFLFVRTCLDEPVVDYVIREHQSGRTRQGILVDLYVGNGPGSGWSTRARRQSRASCTVADDAEQDAREAA